MGKFNDLTGRCFGQLRVVKLGNRAKCGKIRWVCQCDCGNQVEVRSDHLLSGHTTSCGCYNGCCHATHNKTNTRLFRIWGNMKSRCFHTNDKDYKNYGGRGIAVCEEWSNSFEKFYEWSISNGYNDYLTIDRIDVNGNYEPNNCRWTTIKHQNNNRRNNKMITYKGETHTLSQWCEKLNLSYDAIEKRLTKYGYSIERAFTQPVRPHKKR